MAATSAYRSMGIRNELRDLSDTGLAERFNAGEPAAFDMLYERHRLDCLRIVMSRVHDIETAEDIVQETFLKILRHMPKFDRTKSFRAWCHRSVWNLCSTHLRSGASRMTTPFSYVKREESKHFLSQYPDKKNNVVDDTERREIREALDQALEGLPTMLRTFFIMRHVEDRSCADISEITGVPVSTVRAYTRLARRTINPHLRRRLR